MSILNHSCPFESPNPFVAKSAEFAQEEMKGNDGSHDWFHIERVWKLARRLAVDEKLPEESVEVVELAALLHDVKDWKYSKSETAAAESITDFLTALQYPSERLAKILHIVAHVSFKGELGMTKELIAAIMCPELAVVQDADRLDAIGAIGIARTFCYGGRFDRALYDPSVPPRTELTKDSYMYESDKQHTVNVFYEKLLLLKDKMKTESGRRMAQERHTYMESFLHRFHGEWAGEA